MKNLHITVLVAGLLMVSGFLFAYKALVLDFPLTETDTAESWKIEARVRIDAKGGETMATLFLPASEKRFGIFGELHYSGEYGFTKSVDEMGNRRITWTAREMTGKTDLYYTAEVYRFKTASDSEKPIAKPERFLAYEPFISEWPSIKQAALNHIFERYKAKSADIDSFIAVAVEDISNDELTQTERVLLNDPGGKVTMAGRAVGITLMARMMGYPARPVQGIDLSVQGRQVKPVHWVEVLKEGKWQEYDLNTGLAGVSEDYLPWWRGLNKPALVSGAKLNKISFSVKKQSRPKIMSSAALAKIQKNLLSSITLFDLPIETQQVYRVILMVPLGALLIIFLRQIIGMKTFGTFMPVLIALSFRETDIVQGVFMFTALVAAGLIFRFYFEKLKLLAVPRLAVVMIMVIILMICLSMVLDKLEIGSGLSVALFPLVILTMTIERMMIIWEEYGPRESIGRAMYSLVAAVLAYLVMNIKALNFYFFVYPELLLVVLAVSIILGRYTGYRLTELFRFRSFVEENPVKKA